METSYPFLSLLPFCKLWNIKIFFLFDLINFFLLDYFSNLICIQSKIFNSHRFDGIKFSKNFKSLQALSAEVSNVGAVSGSGAGGEVDSSAYNRHRRLTSLYSSYGPEAAAIMEARNMASKRKPPVGPAGLSGLGGSGGSGPSSLFIFSDDNFIRRHTRFIIEWPYPFHSSVERETKKKSLI